MTTKTQAPSRQAAASSSHWRIVAWMMLATSFALLSLIISVREVLLAQITKSANENVVHELGELRQFTELTSSPMKYWVQLIMSSLGFCAGCF